MSTLYENYLEQFRASMAMHYAQQAVLMTEGGTPVAADDDEVHRHVDKIIINHMFGAAISILMRLKVIDKFRLDEVQTKARELVLALADAGEIDIQDKLGVDPQDL